MEEGEVQDQDRTDGQPQKFARYQENGQSPECTDKGVVWSDERIDESVLRWFGHVERLKNDRIAKRVYVGQSDGCH